MGMWTKKGRLKKRILDDFGGCMGRKLHICMVWVLPRPCNSRKGFTFRFKRRSPTNLLLGLLQVGGSSQCIVLYSTLRILTPLLETPDLPYDSPLASRQCWHPLTSQGFLGYIYNITKDCDHSFSIHEQLQSKGSKQSYPGICPINVQ